MRTGRPRIYSPAEAEERKHQYSHRPDVKERNRLRQLRPDVKQRYKMHRQLPKVQEKLRQYTKEYLQRPGIREKRRANSKRHRHRVMDSFKIFTRGYFTFRCSICGCVDPHQYLGVVFHEKNGRYHERNALSKFVYILLHYSDFVPLCRKHHSTAHVLMSDAGLTWEEILSLFSTND
jgi:hypothetical protein